MPMYTICQSQYHVTQICLQKEGENTLVGNANLECLMSCRLEQECGEFDSFFGMIEWMTVI